MTEDGLYIGVVQERFNSGAVNRIIVLPLMEWIEQNNTWLDIDKDRRRKLFPDKGLIICFINDMRFLENQVLKFRVYQNPNYIPGSSIRHAKFSVDRNHFCVLSELLILDFEGSESDLREAILSGKMRYDQPYNSECLIALGTKRWLGLLKLRANGSSVTVHSPSQREGAGGRATRWHGDISPLPTSPRWGEGSERLHLSHHLVPTDPENWRNLEIRQIDESDRIRPAYLDGRVFIDPDHNFGKLINLENWQPNTIFVKRLINRLYEHLQKSKSVSKSSLDFYEFVNLVRQQRRDRAILHRLQEHENMNGLQQEDIDTIIQLLMSIEPFHNELERNKQVIFFEAREKAKVQAEKELTSIHHEKAELELQAEQIRQEIAQLHQKSEEQLEQKFIKVQEEIEEIKQRSYEQIEQELAPVRQEKSDMEQKVIELGREAAEIELTIKYQRIRMSQILNQFDQSLTERFNRFASEPTGMLAEVLANDAFLQLVLGNNQRRLEFRSSTLSPSSTPIFEIKQGPFFENAEAMLTKYRKRLEQVDLDESLAALTTAITLSGQIPVFKGHALRRALNVFENHLIYGRCFELPLSPEIISIERLFTIGQSSDAASLGILDTAILCAATHRNALFILVLEGLDRAPSQYFMDTLLDWYRRGFLDIPSDKLLSQHLERLWTKYNAQTQCGLAKEMIGWPSNLLLMATINGLADGFPMSSIALNQIVEINVESQGNHLDNHPALLEKIACKRAGEIAVDQWDKWRENAKNQDINLMTQFIRARPKNEQADVAKQEIALQVFAALCALEESKDNALKIIQKYLLGST